MKIPNDECDESSLAKLGLEASGYIARGAYREVADLFGYALAFGKDPARAIEADIVECLTEIGAAARLASSWLPEIRIKHFKAGQAPFIALVECRLAVIDSSESLLAELIVTSAGNETHVTLEQISRTS